MFRVREKKIVKKKSPHKSFHRILKKFFFLFLISQKKCQMRRIYQRI